MDQQPRDTGGRTLEESSKPTPSVADTLAASVKLKGTPDADAGSGLVVHRGGNAPIRATIISSHTSHHGLRSNQRARSRTLLCVYQQRTMREAYAELKRLARIDRKFDDERNANKLEELAEKFGEVVDLAHLRRSSL